MLPLQDPLLIFTLMVVIILVAPLVASRCRIPDLVLLLIAGTVLGPNGAGVLERNTAITLFGSVGLIYIMFLAGLEIDLHQFLATRRRSLRFGLLTFAIPQGLGALAGRYVLGLDWSAAVLLASMFASHTLLAYPIASRMGISRREPVTVTVSATIVTDTLALLVLAVIADSARGVTMGPAFWVGIGAGMAILLLLIWFGIPWLTQWFFQRVSEAGGAQFLFVLATVCVCAYLSHFARLEPIIGAFLAGAAFNRLIPEHSTLMNRVAFVGNNLFIPFFLVSVGMLVDPRAFTGSPHTWLVAVTMVVAVIVTKYLAAWVAARWFGYDRDSREVMFGLSVVQAAATLAAVLVGYNLKIFDDAVLNGAIMMIAVTVPLGAIVVDRHARRMALRAGPELPIAGRGQRLLVALTNPTSAPPLLDLAFVLRRQSSSSAIHALTVVRDEGDTAKAIARGENLMSHCLTRAAAADIPLQPLVRVDTNPADGIVRAAKELRTTTVLIGWRGNQAIADRFFGSVSMQLLQACGARLLFCRISRPMSTCGRLLLLWHPLAERRTDRDALLDDVQQLAVQFGLEIRAFVVGNDYPELRDRLETMVPPRPWSAMVVDSLGLAQDGLLAEVRDNDVIFLPCERRGGSLWTPAFDGLPDRVATRFRDHNLLVTYPDIPAEWDAEPPAAMADSEPGPLTLLPLTVAATMPLAEALGKAATVAMDAERQAGEVHRLLLESSRHFPMELSEGVVLLHGHCATQGPPLVLVLRSRGAWELPDIASPFSLVIGLISPAELSPERHLLLLRNLAVAFRDQTIADAIRSAGSDDEVRQLLLPRIRQ